jgi:DNA polymerase
MQRREFLRSTLALGAAGLLPSMEIASGSPVTAPPSKTEQLRLIKNEVMKCTQCPELVCSRRQPVFGSGNPNAEIVFIGEAPGAEEDKQGEPFVGRAGKVFDDFYLKNLNLRREDVFLCNTVCCRPPGNRMPSSDEVDNCEYYLHEILRIMQPKVICRLGAVAAQSFWHPDVPFQSLRGEVFYYVHDIIGDTLVESAIVCTYHPAYLLRHPAAKSEAWDDIQLIRKVLEERR